MKKYDVRLEIRGKNGLYVSLAGKIDGALDIDLEGLEKVVSKEKKEDAPAGAAEATDEAGGSPRTAEPYPESPASPGTPSGNPQAQPMPQPGKPFKPNKAQLREIYSMIGEGAATAQIMEAYPGLTHTSIAAYRAHYTRRQMK